MIDDIETLDFNCPLKTAVYILMSKDQKTMTDEIILQRISEMKKFVLELKRNMLCSGNLSTAEGLSGAAIYAAKKEGYLDALKDLKLFIEASEIK